MILHNLGGHMKDSTNRMELTPGTVTWASLQI